MSESEEQSNEPIPEGGSGSPTDETPSPAETPTTGGTGESGGGVQPGPSTEYLNLAIRVMGDAEQMFGEQIANEQMKPEHDTVWIAQMILAWNAAQRLKVGAEEMAKERRALASVAAAESGLLGPDGQPMNRQQRRRYARERGFNA